jgi:hypothetical protein
VHSTHPEKDLVTGAIAQLGERLNGIQEVGGSIPPSSTTVSRAVLQSLTVPKYDNNF